MIEFDFSKSGLSSEQISSNESQLQKIKTILDEERKSGKIGWWHLPFDQQVVEPIRGLARNFSNRFENLVVLGIGGSSQGLKALASALQLFEQKPRLFILESPDPRSIRLLMNRIDLSKTCFNVISKSGNTIETLTLFEYFRSHITKDQIVITTEKGEGKLYQQVQKENLTHLEIPKNVGGRFSVFSAVGLFPLAFLGLDIETLLDGARKADISNAYQNGTAHFLLNRDHHKTISVMMPYADCLFDFGRWYAQLWAESLGKEGKGQTPLVALGPQDQHSLAQLFLDGPKDKVVTLIKIAAEPNDALGELLEKECMATAKALAEKGCPVVTLTLPQLDAFHMGELLMTYQMQTAFVGHLMGINPYDQPAVESIKKWILF